MRTPKNGSFNDGLARLLIDGPKTMVEIVSHHKHRNYGTMAAKVSALKHFGVIESDGNLHRLTRKARIHYGLEVEPEPVVLPVIAPCFETKPIDRKWLPSLEPRRNDALPIRRISFITCSGGEFRVLGDRP